MNSLTLTGVESGIIADNTLSGSNMRQAIFLEKRKNLYLSGEIKIENNIITNSINGDISTNYNGYGSDAKAKVLIKSSAKNEVKGISGY